MKMFDGRLHAQKLEEQIVEGLKQLASSGKTPGILAIVQIGDNVESEKYVALKKKLGEKLGLLVETFKFAATLSDLELEKQCLGVFKKKDVSSVIVQLPLPREALNTVLNKIPVEKDIDMLSENPMINIDNLSLKRTSPVIRACEYFIGSINLSLSESTAVIVGGGKLVGKPIANRLKKAGCAVQIVEDYKPGKPLNADLIVLSAGIPNLVKGEDISTGANVIDFGSSVVAGKTIGDLDLTSKLDHLGTISPSPGGMGPLVVRFLFMNHLRL